MSLFNLPVAHKSKPENEHPWARSILDAHSHKIKNAHNAVNNAVYPKPKPDKVHRRKRFKFTLIGNMVTKEFIHCVHLVNGMHKYRWKNFDAPVIRGVTSVEWPHVLNELKLQYGGLAFCLLSPVAVICNGQFVGGDKELKELIELHYVYHLSIDYEKESEKMFVNFIKSTGRVCVYFHISIRDKPSGCLIFMLYTDIVPNTCENFIRLCKKRKGGYAGTPIHRIVKDCFIQCGGFGLKDMPMECENFVIPHDRRGVLGMANNGRHIDCSTQFYVLLQPSDWMNYKYVAFGQLIEGEHTLKEIEKQRTFFESPVPKIKIDKAGILNFDCKSIYFEKDNDALRPMPLHKSAEGRDLPYHVGVYEYIQGHIEDLVSVGELFTKMLMEHVFLEIEFRYLTTLEMPKGEGEEQERARSIILQNNLHTTKRFMRKKEEIQNQLAKNMEKAVDKRGSCASYAASNQSKKDDVNNDFDVDDYWYEYEAEEYLYSQQSKPGAPASLPPAKPFYLPLTDVPYPGEVDSIYDLRRFLQGDYCLESDIDPRQALSKQNKKRKKEKAAALSQVLMSYHHVVSESEEEEEVEEEESSSELDTDDEKEISKYLSVNAERVSFSGNLVKKMGRHYMKHNPLEEKTSDELFTDEEIRRLKLAKQDLQSREINKVSISVEPWETHTQIKRKQTGFERPGGVHMVEEENNDDDDDDSDDDDDDLSDEERKRKMRQVSLHVPGEEHKPHQIKRRPTGFVRPEDLKRLHISPHLDDDDEEEEEEEDGRAGKVRIASGSRTKTAARKEHRLSSDSDDDEDKTRPSVLARLYDDAAIDDDFGTGPTLKDYVPPAEGKHKKNVLLTASSGRVLQSDDDINKDYDLFRKEHYLRPALHTAGGSEQILALQHGKKPVKRMSIDFVKTVDHLERRPEQTLRTIDISRHRPSLTIEQYQLRNRMREAEEKRKKIEDAQNDEAKLSESVKRDAGNT